MSTPNGGSPTAEVVAEQAVSQEAALAMARALARHLSERGYVTDVVATGRRWPGVRVTSTVTGRLSETVQLGTIGGDTAMAFFWSWGEIIGHDPYRVAAAVAKVLTARPETPAAR